MKPAPSLSIDDLMKSDITNLIRLANYLGIDTNKYKDLPDCKWKISTSIIRWYKKNPQKKKRSKTVGMKDYRLSRLGYF